MEASQTEINVCKFFRLVSTQAAVIEIPLNFLLERFKLKSIELFKSHTLFVFLYSKACKEPLVSSTVVMLSSLSNDIKRERCRHIFARGKRTNRQA